MRRMRLWIVLVLVSSQALAASTTLQLNLEELCSRAQRIFRGQVLEARESRLEVGGGVLPIVTYTLEVTEIFKGRFAEVDGRRTVEVTMLGRPPTYRVGDVGSLAALGDLPSLEVGRQYLLLTTAPSALGLSTTVGLGQGRFQIAGVGVNESVTNDLGNAGLIPGTAAGAMPYSDLAHRIRAAIGPR